MCAVAKTLPSHHRIDLGQLAMAVHLHGDFSPKQTLTQVEENFLRLEAKPDQTADVTMTFLDSGSIQDPAGAAVLQSLPGSRLYADRDGFLMQRFIPEQQSLPFLSIRINHDFTDFVFHFDPTRYTSLFAEQGFRIDWFQYACSQNLLIPTLLGHNGLLIHGSGGVIQDKGMIFAAPSGTGKSTLARLLLASPGNRLFSEERLLVQQQENEQPLQLWGTPWHGSGDLARNEKTDFAALVFLSQAPETTIKPLTTSAGLERLLQVASIPWYSRYWAQKGLDLSENLLKEVPVYELAFAPDQCAVQVVEELAASL
jgi:hypothetical protein